MRKRDRNSSELRVPPAIRRTRDIPPSVHGVHGRPSESHLATPQISTRSGLVASVAEGEGELNFEFDNSSSWFHGRAVQCTFSVAEPAAGDAAGKELEHQLMKAPDGSYTLWYQ